ncbi:hypothetical protein PMAYCL1PPCAC_08186, partial [Pristionchus mayeri]
DNRSEISGSSANQSSTSSNYRLIATLEEQNKLLNRRWEDVVKERDMLYEEKKKLADAHSKCETNLTNMKHARDEELLALTRQLKDAEKAKDKIITELKENLKTWIENAHSSTKAKEKAEAGESRANIELATSQKNLEDEKTSHEHLRKVQGTLEKEKDELKNQKCRLQRKFEESMKVVQANQEALTQLAESQRFFILNMQTRDERSGTEVSPPLPLVSPPTLCLEERELSEGAVDDEASGARELATFKGQTLLFANMHDICANKM